MGTNYYIKTKTCKTCGHKPESIHLGKSSAGWQFSFQYNGGKYYKDVNEMRIWLADKKITDEYEDEVSYQEFWKMVEDKQKEENQNHAEYCHKHYPETKTREYIIDGYSFSDVEFC